MTFFKYISQDKGTLKAIQEGGYESLQAMRVAHDDMFKNMDDVARWYDEIAGFKFNRIDPFTGKQKTLHEAIEEAAAWNIKNTYPTYSKVPEIIKIMKDAGCAYISFGFESASNKVLNEDIQKGQLRSHLQKTLEAVKKEKMTPLTTFMIGNPHENIDDLMETVDFWIQNEAEIDPFICTPYVGSPIFYEYKDYILGQYDERLKLVNNGKHFDENLVQKWKLSALDKFMSECGDAFQYTATVSQYFTIPDLFAIKNFMYRHDTDRLLKMAHQRYEETGKEQWTHSEKWEKYCPVCKVKNEFNSLIVK